MIQDIFPHIYHNEMSWRTPRAGDFLLLLKDGRVCAHIEDGAVELPQIENAG